LYLTLDQGGHATRAIVFDGKGNKLVEHACSIDTLAVGNRVEIDAEKLIASFDTVLRDTFAELGADARRIERVGLATQRSNIACWHRDTLEPLGPVLSWQDRRAPAYLEGLDAEAVHGATGLFPNPHYGASKLAWCLDHLDAVKQAAAADVLRMGPMASFITARLTGSRAVADPVNSSRTLLWSLETGDWDTPLCCHFGIQPRWLPPCVESRHRVGRLTPPDAPPGAAAGPPVGVVTGDLSAAAFARGRPREDTLYVTLGTGAFLQRVVTEHRTLHPRLLTGVLWRAECRHVHSLEGTVNGAGSALSWLAEADGVSPDSLFERLAAYDPAAGGMPLFLNGVSGLGSPFWVADFEPRFVGEAGVDQKAFAVVESIVFLIVKNFETMEAVLPSPRGIVVGGGLSGIDGLCKALAALTGKPVERSAEAEATAKGLAYLLADGPEQWPVQAGVMFPPASCSNLKQRYADWSQALGRALSQET